MNILSQISAVASIGISQDKIRSARKNFFSFCNLTAPDFYKPNREYLVRLCDGLQEFYTGNEENLIINLPPRHGKSRTATLFVQWILGQNPHEKIMTGSYNETLSTTFSKAVRNAISEQKADPNIVVYNDIFPDIHIKHGDGAMNLWSLEGQYSNYLATSPTGTATGFGCSLMIIDDLIKNSYEACNENILDEHWSWFTNTMLSRLEANGKTIIIMTRWSSNDLAGKAINYFTEEDIPFKLITMKALQSDGTMLCDDVLSYNGYIKKTRLMGADIASANYQQEPIDMKGRLYTHFKTYDYLPVNESGKSLFTEVLAYCDTADTGSDYLCNIIYGVYNGDAYILDVYYTKDAMEKTESETAKRYYEFAVNRADIESNNGGRGFARNIGRILKGKFRTNRTVIKPFHQSANKKARILSNASWVMEHIIYPSGWQNKFPDYYKAMITYQREGKNAHDDAPDATTGIAEKLNDTRKGRVIKRKGWGL